VRVATDRSARIRWSDRFPPASSSAHCHTSRIADRPKHTARELAPGQRPKRSRGQGVVAQPSDVSDNLTVENIRAGNSNIRNPTIASFVAKGVLPYRVRPDRLVAQTGTRTRNAASSSS
jgi:hypothetical protein